MISTALRDLISNAIKFTASGDDIKIFGEVKHKKVEISLSDTGVGLSVKAIGKLFRSDTQHVTPGTQNEQGRGLGLILCKEFIEKHQEKIWVESEPDKGSVFHFTLPYNYLDNIYTIIRTHLLRSFNCNSS